MVPEPPRSVGFGAFWSALCDHPRALMFGAWFTIFPLIVAIPFSVLTVATSAPSPNRAKILAAGADTTGEVTAIETIHNETINGVRPRKVFFRYIADGRTNEAAMETLSVEEVNDWHPGRQIAVRYLGNNATIPILEPADFPVGSILLMPVFLGIFGLPFLLYSIIYARNKVKVIRFGIARPARLLSLAPVASFGLGRLLKTRFEAHYVFQGNAGGEVFGCSLTTDLALLNEKKKGDQIEILVLPDRETKSVILDFPMLRQIQAGSSAR